jgi:hypothetical protein
MNGRRKFVAYSEDALASMPSSTGPAIPLPAPPPREKTEDLVKGLQNALVKYVPTTYKPPSEFKEPSKKVEEILSSKKVEKLPSKKAESATYFNVSGASAFAYRDDDDDDDDTGFSVSSEKATLWSDMVYSTLDREGEIARKKSIEHLLNPDDIYKSDY